MNSNTSLLDAFWALTPEQRCSVHFNLCAQALRAWLAFIQASDRIEYIEGVAGTRQGVDPHLPAEAYQAARLGLPDQAITHRYLEPITALQDADVEFPQAITIGYYALYNLFRRWAQAEPVDDWLITNQALSAVQPGQTRAELARAIPCARLLPGDTTPWQLWYRDTFDRETPPAVEASGEGILRGLYELWLHTLREGLMDNGGASFSYFSLTWGSAPVMQVDAGVQPFDNASLLKLRQWIQPMAQDQQSALLTRLAQLHFEQLAKSSRFFDPPAKPSDEASLVLARVALVPDFQNL